MSSPQSVLMGLVEQQLLQLRTAFVGEVVSVNRTVKPATAVVEPVLLYKLQGEVPKKYPLLRDVPVLRGALEDVKAGALVLCLCTDRDLSLAARGHGVLPSSMHHKMNDAVVVGVF